MKVRAMDVMCQAVATFYGPESAHVASEALRGSCAWRARHYRDGLPVCGVHRRAKTVEWQDQTEAKMRAQRLYFG